MNRVRMAAAAALALAGGTAHAAVSFDVNVNGKLVGATGVVIDGAEYDVSFNNSCADAYGSCTNSANFPFSEAVASLDAQALLDQVFIDSAAGSFASDPNSILGCETGDNCFGIIPYTTIQGSQFLRGVAAVVRSTGINNVIPVSVFPESELLNGSYVNFTRAAAVPEPETWALMILGFSLVGAAARRRRSGVTA